MREAFIATVDKNFPLFKMNTLSKMVGFPIWNASILGLLGQLSLHLANGNIHMVLFGMHKVFVFYPKTTLCSCVSSEISQNTLFWKAEWMSFCWKSEFLTG